MKGTAHFFRVPTVLRRVFESNSVLDAIWSLACPGATQIQWRNIVLESTVAVSFRYGSGRGTCRTARGRHSAYLRLGRDSRIGEVR